MNACTLVLTVFLAHGKMEFELPVSFFVYPQRRKWEFIFYFCFLFSQYIENEIGTSIFVFRFSITSCNRIAIAISVFHLLFSYGIEKRNLNFDFRFSFSFSIIMISDETLAFFRFAYIFPPRFIRSSKWTSQLTVCNGLHIRSQL